MSLDERIASTDAPPPAPPHPQPRPLEAVPVAAHTALSVAPGQTLVLAVSADRAASPEQAAAYPWTPIEREFVAQRWEGQAIGGPETVRRQLGELLEATQANELMVTAHVYAPADRIRSLELTRALFGDQELPRGLATTGALGFAQR